MYDPNLFLKIDRYNSYENIYNLICVSKSIRRCVFRNLHTIISYLINKNNFFRTLPRWCYLPICLNDVCPDIADQILLKAEQEYPKYDTIKPGKLVGSEAAKFLFDDVKWDNFFDKFNSEIIITESRPKRHKTLHEKITLEHVVSVCQIQINLHKSLIYVTPILLFSYFTKNILCVVKDMPYYGNKAAPIVSMFREHNSSPKHYQIFYDCKLCAEHARKIFDRGTYSVTTEWFQNVSAYGDLFNSAYNMIFIL